MADLFFLVEKENLIHTVLMNMTIRKSDTLTEEEIEDIRRVVALCNTHDGTAFEFDPHDDFLTPGQYNYFLLYRMETLVAAVYLFTPSTTEAEVYAFTIPDDRRRGFMTELLKEVREEAARRQFSSLLFVCDSNSVPGRGFLEHRRTPLEFSEYAMTWHPPMKKADASRISLRPVEKRDREILIEINSEAFNEERSASAELIDLFFSSEKRDFYTVINSQGKVIGMIGRYREESRDYIHAFAMERAVRGKGLGEQALSQMVELCREGNPSRSLELEVETKNERALGLYQRCGFQVTGRFDYYRERV